MFFNHCKLDMNSSLYAIASIIHYDILESRRLGDVDAQTHGWTGQSAGIGRQFTLVELLFRLRLLQINLAFDALLESGQ